MKIAIFTALCPSGIVKAAAIDGGSVDCSSDPSVCNVEGDDF